MKNKWLGLVVLALMALLGALAFPFLPDRIPSHWNVAGEVDGYMNRFWGTWFLPLLALAVWLMLRALPGLDPKGEQYAAFAGTYRLFINMLMLFFGGLYVVTLAAALGWNMPVGRLVTGAVGVLFAVMGNELSRVTPNYFVGVRTPWTLADPEVWRLTHRFAGRAMVVAGMVCIVAALAFSDVVMFAVVLVAALGFALASVVYSYLVYRRLHAK